MINVSHIEEHTGLSFGEVLLVFYIGKIRIYWQ